MNISIDEDSKWEALHLQLQDLLAGYADDMLNGHNKSVIEAHLSGCESCRADVARQQIITQRLNNLPHARLSTQAHLKLDSTLSNARPPAAEIGPPWHTKVFNNWYQMISTPRFIATSGWSVSIALIAVILLPHLMPNNNHNPPMVEDVIAEYLHLDTAALPASSNNPLPELPANWPNARLLASWDTKVGGAPAKAFAMRDGNNIVIQYRIDEVVFFRNPGVRQAVSDKGSYLVKQNNLQVLALPLKNFGLLVVGPAGRVPAPETITIAKVL